MNVYSTGDKEKGSSNDEGKSAVDAVDICGQSQPNRTICQRKAKPSKMSVVAPILKTFRDRHPPGSVENILKEHEARLSGSVIEWTEAQIINPILSMIEVSKNCPFLITKRDGSFGIDPKHRLRGEGTSVRSIAVYVVPLLESHRQLIALTAFTKRTNTDSKMVEVLQELLIKFLCDHSLTINRSYTDSFLCAQMLAYSLRNELRALSIVYDALSNVLDTDVWTYETVDKFIERLLRLTQYAEIQTKFVKRIVRGLQVAVFSVLKRYFNSIFGKGVVEETFADEFIFYNVNDGDTSNALRVRVTACSFWSSILVRNVLAGARDAKRLRTNSNVTPTTKFSTYFMRYLYGNGKIEFVKASDIILSAERAAVCCARDNAKQLFTFVRRNNALDIIMHEIELIFTGFALRELAFDLFGATREAPISSIVLSFYNSLQMSGFTEERCNQWNVRCDNGTLEQLSITPKLPWPIEFVVDDRFIETANRCIRFLLKLMRAKEILSRIRIQYDKVHGKAFSQRKLHHLISLTAQPLTTMAELLFTHLQSLIAKKIPAMLECSTVTEAHSHLMSLNSQLDHLVSQEGCARALVHGAVSKLCDLAEQLDARLTVDILNDTDLEEMLKMVLREKELLMGLGKALQGTIFNALELFLW